MILNNSPSAIASGGTGYTVGDVLTLVGGTPASVAGTFTVSSVSGGVITGIGSTNFASYTSLPTNPVSVTGGTGTGATITATWVISSTFTITNAGSGYVEQPTVTFSGGGGSGAAAYASVGSTTKIQSLASPLEIHTPSGVAFRVADIGVTSAAYWTAYGGSAIPELRASGAGIVSVTGSNSLQFRTNVSTQQFNIAHTASAVNYVQVTGAATGNSPTISSQGSDANSALQLASKNTAAVSLITNAAKQFDVYGPTSAANFIRAAGAVAGSAPSFTASGSDTNIDLTLTPKGTGKVRFGTYTANMALVIQGYIEIKDSGGTVRKLAVIA
jgi:hypothetical protein